MLVLVENLRRKQLAWLEAVLLHRNWNMSELAEAAKVDPSTLSKFRSDPENIKQLSTRVVAKVEHASGLPAYDTKPPAPTRGFVGQDAQDISSNPPSPELAAAMASAVKAGRNAVETWVLLNQVLKDAGYLAGDILLVDREAEPHPGDIVRAEIIDAIGDPQTVIRIYEDPYLVAASSEPGLRRPLHIGRDPVVLRGVVISSFRSRRAA